MIPATAAMLATTAILLLTGCVNIHAYPVAWPDRRTTPVGSCADISGSFGRCDMDTGANGYQCLTLFLNHTENRLLAPAQRLAGDNAHVTIEQNENTIAVSYWADGAVISRKDLTKNGPAGFRCEPDGVVVSSSGDAMPQNMAGYMPSTYTLAKASDGSLVVKYQDYGAGLGSGFIPIAGVDTIWERAVPYTGTR